MTNREKYRLFCETEENIPLFSKDWFLDSVCGVDNWDVALVEKGDDVVASLPFYKKKKATIFTIITLPKHTQTMGVYIKYPKQEQKYEKKLSYEKEVMTNLIEQLPKVDYFDQSFHYSITNWLPFYWKGYTQTTKYTYVIENLSDTESVFKNFDNAKRRHIKRAEKIVEVKFDLPVKEFYEHHKMTLEKQGDEIAYSFEHFDSMYKSAYSHNAGKSIYAIDGEGNIHAAFFVVWDKNSAYYLISTIDPSFRSGGATSLLMKKIIEFLSTKTDRFDFEGSMIEPVEKSFRQFGAKQKPYFNITKIDSKILKPLVLL